MSENLRFILKKSWISEDFKQVVERRISDSQGVEQASLLVLKEVHKRALSTEEIERKLKELFGRDEPEEQRLAKGYHGALWREDLPEFFKLFLKAFYVYFF